jgi:nucleoside-diphosphate-sugar epimerase
MTRVALFGRTGFIGRKVAEQLGAASIPFVGISSSSSGEDTIRIDLSDVNAFTAIPSDVDRVIICYAKLPQRSYSINDIRDFLESNVEATINILDWAARASIRRIVYCSTLSMIPAHDEGFLIDIHSHYPYKITKAAAEHLLAGFCAEKKIPFMILRIASVYGPGMKPDVIKMIVDSASKGNTFTLNNKNASADFVHVDDVATAIVKSLSVEPADFIVNVSSGTHTLLAELCRIVDPEMKVVTLSDSPVATREHSSSEFRTLIGREPVNIREGILEMINHYRE